MSPDKKYMGSKNTQNSGDLNLVPFKPSMPSMMPVGWIPVFSFNKLNTLAVPNTMMPSFSNIMDNINVPSSQGSINSTNNVENFPSDDDANNLYSYNNPGNNTNNNISNLTNNTTPNSSTNMPPSFNNTTNPNNNFNITSPSNQNQNISNVLRNYFADLDEDTDLLRHCTDKRIDKIYEKVQEKDPEIIAMLIDNYKIPCPIAKAAIRKIIKLSLRYCKKAGD